MRDDISIMEIDGLARLITFHMQDKINSSFSLQENALLARSKWLISR